jgi:hypothetical protein
MEDNQLCVDGTLISSATIRLDEVVEVLPLPQFTSILPDPFRFQLLESFRRGRVCINREDSRSAHMWRSKRFREEAFSRFCIAPRAQEKFQSISLRIHRAREVHPHLFHFHICLIDTPRVFRRLEMRVVAFHQFGCVVLHESGRSWCDRRAIPARASSPPDVNN